MLISGIVSVVNNHIPCGHLASASNKVQKRDSTRAISMSSSCSPFSIFAQLNDRFQRLEKCQNEMNDLIFKDENAEQLFETEFLSAEKYRDRFTELC
ncbi:hypothetical protein TNCV_2287241 [Trichonephila clavipes]|nr:hypothetical protein TNCV_2287241 [Trichonephila clavipes]